MVVDNPLHAAGTLREQHYNVEERDVLYTSMPNEPGSLGRALRLLSDAGINVDYAYASGIDRVAMVGVVIGVERRTARVVRHGHVRAACGCSFRPWMQCWWSLIRTDR